MKLYRDPLTPTAKPTIWNNPAGAHVPGWHRCYTPRCPIYPKPHQHQDRAGGSK
jgi:hypothetical protein